ncbi:DUF2946 family protein [uncultured Abyssibacter sp.]|uniref:DUF2946 family protein n=1 Tax=uncultured Abyssibacter sp. TaxID=2320202 RepID=UPI0032B207B5
MEAWVERALAKWPNVPHLYGWVHLDRKGQWSLKGERVDRPKLVDMIRHNYAADDRGCWYFQNGPQRGYVSLEYTPLVARVDPDGRLRVQTDQTVRAIRRVLLDADGSIVLDTELGAATVDGPDLDWVLAGLTPAAGEGDLETALERAMAAGDGQPSGLTFSWNEQTLDVERADAASMPTLLGFVRDPQPDDA